MLTLGKFITDYSDKGLLFTTKCQPRLSSFLFLSEDIFSEFEKNIVDSTFLVKIRDSQRSFFGGEVLHCEHFDLL